MDPLCPVDPPVTGGVPAGSCGGGGVVPVTPVCQSVVVTRCDTVTCEPVDVILTSTDCGPWVAVGVVGPDGTVGPAPTPGSVGPCVSVCSTRPGAPGGV